MPISLRQLSVQGKRFRRWATNRLLRAGFKEEHFLILMSILIGSTTGLGAAFFYWLIESAHGLSFGHRADGPETLGLFGGRWWMLILLPAIGGLGVGMITFFFAREAKGHGVPEVMDANLRKGGVIRPRVAIAKAVASAMSIGTGGSAGTEGPIVQIGAAIGSSLGQALNLRKDQLTVFVACGAAAGISAIFNAPIAGVLFALEIFLRDFSFRVFSPVVFSSVLSCSIMHAVRGDDRAIFFVAEEMYNAYVFNGAELPFYIVLGGLCALGGVLFIKLLYATEDLFDWLPAPEIFKPALGALVLGGLGAAVYLNGAGEGTAAGVVPAFFGNGYPLIHRVISAELLGETIAWLMVMWSLKLAATCLTLGSGGSGGVFAPSLFMGATLGGALGLGLESLGLIQAASVPAYSLVGMATMVAATTHAPLTAIIILFEITRQYKVILPTMSAAIAAMAIAQLLTRDSIYTLKLRRRGVRMGTLADLTILRRLTAEGVNKIKPCFVQPDDPLQKLLDMAHQAEASDFVVVDEENTYLGMVVAEDIKTALLQAEAVPLLLVAELMRPGIPTVNDSDSLDTVLDKFSRADVQSLPVIRGGENGPVSGLITRRGVMTHYYDQIDRESI